jgi:hypothetical protein
MGSPALLSGGTAAVVIPYPVERIHSFERVCFSPKPVELFPNL